MPNNYNLDEIYDTHNTDPVNANPYFSFALNPFLTFARPAVVRNDYHSENTVYAAGLFPEEVPTATRSASENSVYVRPVSVKPPAEEYKYKNVKLLEELKSTPELEAIGYKTPVVPEKFICPISNQIIDEAVSPRASSDPAKPEYSQCGKDTFEENDIKRWLKIRETNPMTRDPLTKDLLIANDAVQLEIKSWLEEKRNAKIKACIALAIATYYARNFSLIPYASREMVIYSNPTQSFINEEAILHLLLVSLAIYTEMSMAPPEKAHFPISDRITELSEEESAGFQSNSLFAFDDSQTGNLSSNIANNKR